MHVESIVRGTESERRGESSEARVQSTRVQSRECEGEESRGRNTVHDESTMREYTVESAEIARMQSRDWGAECTMGAQFERTESRVQRVRECRVESTVSARAPSREGMQSAR